jgi:hypothetical protein
MSSENTQQTNHNNEQNLYEDLFCEITEFDKTPIVLIDYSGSTCSTMGFHSSKIYTKINTSQDLTPISSPESTPHTSQFTTPNTSPICSPVSGSKKYSKVY